MKKLIYSAAMLTAVAAFSTSAFAQLQDEKNVTINMDLQPILKLDMSTADQVDFVFDEISEYAGGITKYGATVLKISSTVDWSLYAVATSNNAQGGVGSIWDQQVVYGNKIGGGADIPLDALEISMNVPDAALLSSPGAAAGYNVPFTTPDPIGPTVSPNNIDASLAATPYIGAPAIFMEENGVGGSYLTQDIVGGLTFNFVYTIDYRIYPGLPVLFPTSTTGPMAAYAQPGVYTMDVKYLLIEHQ